MPTPAVTQALNALLPSITATGRSLPAPLISQSESLLALSRQRHPNLKAEEEIARAHVCTEIICNRLRVPLRLPAVKSGAGAPCKPTVYKRLYKFLDSALADAAVGSLTPKGTKRTAEGTPKSNGTSGVKRTPLQQLEAETPSKTRTVDKMVGLEFAGSIKKTKKDQTNTSSGDGRAPSYVMPLIRKISKHFGTPSMTPHVYAGSCIVLGLANLWPPPDESVSNVEEQENISGLAIALYLMVLTRMRKGKMTSAVYSQVSSKSLELADLQTADLVKVEDWIARLNDEGWCNGQDWWDSVPEDVIVLGQKQNNLPRDTSGEEMDEDFENISARGQLHWGILRKEDLLTDDPEGVLLPGLGTMFNASNDWTSEDRQADFDAWKSDILKRITTMERAESKKGKRIAAA